MLNTGEAQSNVGQPNFKFELGWLMREGFREKVSQIWSPEYGGSSVLERWQNKIRRVRQFLRGWAKNTSGSNKKEKKEILQKLDILDRKAESNELSSQEIDKELSPE
jgi:hypothetical protein